MLYLALLVVCLGSAWWVDRHGPSLKTLVAVQSLLVLVTAVTAGATWRALRETTFAAPRPTDWLMAVVGIMVTVCIAVLNRAAVVWLLPESEEQFFEAVFGPSPRLGLLLLVVAVLPAVFEELAFRGVILSALLSHLGSRSAVFVSAVMFCLVHLTPLMFPFLLVMGLALGYLRVRSRSLYPSMLLHFAHNAAIVVLHFSR